LEIVFAFDGDSTISNFIYKSQYYMEKNFFANFKYKKFYDI
jgi:hypothetical protein